LGGLLLFSGIELALSSKLHEHHGGDLFLVLLMTAIGVALNPARHSQSDCRSLTPSNTSGSGFDHPSVAPGW